MTEIDNGAFEVAFKRLSGAFQWKGKPSEFEAKRHEYFDALRPFPLDAVLTAADVCRNTLKHFPRIVEWREALVVPSGTKPSDARWMPVDEAATFLWAERQGYEDAPCRCQACQAAGVSHRPLRFVPDDPEERAWCAPLRKLVVVGHWAHGEELARWYVARDRFFQRAAPKHRSWLRVALRLADEREPGEEG